MEQQRKRPVSPHISIYKPQISSVLSILHRITGVALTVGSIFIFWWLVAAASGPTCYNAFQGFITSWFGLLIMFGWSWAFFYHLCTGIRHLFWDMGYGFEIETMTKTGWLAVGSSFVLTLAVWSMYVAG